ncbi:hypothetical protein DICVIV_12139, partial [Dictyocaulus viviparus]
MKISWWKDGIKLVSNEKYEIHELSDGSQILTIHSANVSDNGLYTCKAESVNGLCSSSSCEVIVPTRTIITEKWTESSMHTTTVVEEPTAVIEENKEDYVTTTEITRPEEEYKLLVKVAENVASALIANVFVDAVYEAARRIVEEEEE